jgi:hypothetical protein
MGDYGYIGYVDEVYLYRPGSTQNDSIGFIYTQGNLPQAPFNTANGRTAFNKTTDPKPCFSWGNVENIQNINEITHHPENDSYSFFYGDPEKMRLELNKDTLVIGKLAGSPGTVTVISNMLWFVSIPESAASWLTVSKAKGINEGIVKFTALEENMSGSPRSTEVAFYGNGRSEIVTVIQDIVEAVCNDVIADLSVDFDLDERLASLSWTSPSPIPEPKTSSIILWDNTYGETSNGFQSCCWLGGEDRVVMADDFVIGNGRAWTIDTITCSGRKVGLSPLPDYIGIAIYEDNGDHRPKNTPIIEISRLTPVGGVTSGKMKIFLPEPIVISESGKYWISIYGSYEGETDKTKIFDMASTPEKKEDKMCKWDPTVINGDPQYADWKPFESSSSLYYGISFSLKGTISYPDKILYNIYLDGALIATEIEAKSYQYPKTVKLSEDHNWCVSTICTSGMEGDEVCIQTQGLFYDIEVITDPIKGFVSGSGNYGHWDNVMATATAKEGYVFANWSVNDSIVSTDNPYMFNAKKEISLVGNFEVLVPFDEYAVTKWNNTFMLNIRKFENEGFDLNNCMWYKNGKIIGEGFTYSAGNKVTDLLEMDARYSFKLTTYNRGKVHATDKVITSETKKGLQVYPNPVPHGSKLTIEGTVQGAFVEIFNQMGACVSSTIASGRITELILSIPMGIYIVRSNNEEVKFLIQ